MAAIDKIYGTRAQRDQFWSWCAKHKPAALQYFYSWYNEYDDDDEAPITNFPEDIDMWLLANCPIKFVTGRVKEQYSIEEE